MMLFFWFLLALTSVPIWVILLLILASQSGSAERYRREFDAKHEANKRQSPQRPTNPPRA